MNIGAQGWIPCKISDGMFSNEYAVVLSNTAILEAINKGALTIEPLAGRNPSDSPFNTSAVDLRLGTEILRPKEDQPIALDLRRKGISLFLHQHCVSFYRPHDPCRIYGNYYARNDQFERERLFVISRHVYLPVDHRGSEGFTN